MSGYHPQFRDRVGTILAEKYLLRDLLGIGGMAAVFEAENTWTGGHVAIKLLLTEEDDDEERTTRFMQEARAATRVQHPNIVQVFDMGRDPEDGSLFIVQEFLTGQDLRALLDARRTLSVRSALQIMIPVMDGLRAAHEQGIVHRDIKPANIFLSRTPNGEICPKLIDFGVVKIASSDGITKTGTTIGTPEYMSPEQAHGDKSIDAQTDVWSAGIVLYEMLAGRPPFLNENYHQLLVNIIWEDAPRLNDVVPNLPAGLADVVHRALVRDRGGRYPSMRAFLDAVLSCIGLANEPWMQTLAMAYAPRRATPGPHDVTGFVAMPIGPASPVHVAAPSSEETTSPMPPTVARDGTTDRNIPARAIQPHGAVDTAAPEQPSITPPPTSRTTRSSTQRGVLVVIGLAIAGVIGAVLALQVSRSFGPARSASPTPAQETAVPAPPVRSPAVVTTNTTTEPQVVAPPVRTPSARVPSHAAPANPRVAQVAAHAPNTLPTVAAAPQTTPTVNPRTPAQSTRRTTRATHTTRTTAHPATTTHRNTTHRTRNGAPILSVP